MKKYNIPEKPTSDELRSIAWEMYMDSRADDMPASDSRRLACQARLIEDMACIKDMQDDAQSVINGDIIIIDSVKVERSGK